MPRHGLPFRLSSLLVAIFRRLLLLVLASAIVLVFVSALLSSPSNQLEQQQSQTQVAAPRGVPFPAGLGKPRPARPGLGVDQREQARRARRSRSRRFASRATAAMGAGSLDASSIFMEAASYNSGGKTSFSIAVVDVNGDGHPDLLVANECVDSNCTSGGVGVLLGNGDGTFQTAASYKSGGDYAVSIAVADVNRDGRPDLLVAGGGVSVLVGNGDGTFQAAVSYNSGGLYANAIAVA